MTSDIPYHTYDFNKENKLFFYYFTTGLSDWGSPCWHRFNCPQRVKWLQQSHKRKF